MLPPRTAPAAVALRIPAGTVALALGNVGIATSDADVLFYNPGMLTSARGMSSGVQRYGTNGTAVTLAGAQMFGAYGAGIGVRFVDWQSSAEGYIDAVREGLGALGHAGSGRASSTALTAAAARAVGPVRLGLGVTYVREIFRAEHGESVQFDLGAVMPIGPTNLALTVQHIGKPLSIPQLSADGSTWNLEGASAWRATLGYGGWGYPLATFFDLGGNAQISVDETGTLRSAGGLELSYVPIEGVAIATRLGFRSSIGNEKPVTAGLGFTLDRVSLDYALEQFTGVSAAHRFGLRLR